MLKKLISMLLVFMLVFMSLPMQKAAAKTIVQTGNYGNKGDNVKWTLYSDGELIIEGTGDMDDNYYSPWRDLNVQKVTIKKGVTYIGESAFRNCSALTSIAIPNSVRAIGWGSFSDCTSLTSIAIPESVTSMGGFVFSGCTALTSIKVDSKNKNYSSLDGVLFNKGKTMLIQYPEGKTTKTYTIPRGVTDIGDGAFYGCSALTSIVIPKSVTEIGFYAFQDCTSLTSIVIPKSVTYIGFYAFSDCTSLTSIVIPKSVTEIGSDAFWNCDKLTIYGDKNSYAQSYAKNNDIPFKLIGEFIGPTEPTTGKKAIIVIPGITGSELWGPIVGDYKKIWIGDGSIDLLGNELACDNLGESNNPNIFAFNDSDTSFGTLGIFSNLVNDLKHTYSSKGWEVQFFSYDWRLTNTKSAKELNDFVEKNKYDEVILVCHSMGGIVASLYMAEFGDTKVNKLITLGTPFLGSPKALYAFETGKFLEGFLGIVSSSFVKDMIPNMPGVYELLPNERYFETNEKHIEIGGNYYLERYYWERMINGQYVKKKTSCSFSETESIIQTRKAFWFNQSIYNTSKSIHLSLNSTYKKIISGKIDSYIIAGYNTKTISRLSYAPSTGYFQTLDINKWGDGTVPLISSTFNFADMERIYYVNSVSHKKLASDGKCIQLVKNIINGYGDTDNGDSKSYNYNCEGAVSKAITTKKLAFTGYKIIADCPVELTVKDKNNNWIGTIDSDKLSAAEGHYYDFYVCGKDNETKIAFVDDDSYIEINGTDSGKMDFTIEQYVDDVVIKNITYTDVPITKTTVITTDTDISDSSVLNVYIGNDKIIDKVIKPDIISTYEPNNKISFKLTKNIKIINIDDSAQGLLINNTLTAKEIKALSENKDLTIKDKDGKEIKDGELVGSGATINLINDGKVLDKYTVVVLGDTNGDAKVTAADARLALRMSAQLENKLYPWQKPSADANGDGNIKASDARAILRVSAKLDKF